MGAVSLETEIPSTLAPSKVFKAMVLDVNTILPKVLPSVKSIEIIEGDGGAGSVREVKIAQGDVELFVKERVDSIDEEKLTGSYTVIEGTVLMGKFEKITNHIRFEASPDGSGTIIKPKTTYYPIGDNVLNEEELRVGKQQADGIFVALEAYLLAHPEA